MILKTNLFHYSLMVAAMAVAISAFPISTSAQKRMLFVGDSVTDGGWGRSGGSAKPSKDRNHSDRNHLTGHSYVFLAEAAYTSEHPEEAVTFINRGISGDDMARLEQRWQTDVLDEHPDVLTILVGTNDVHYHLTTPGYPFSADHFAERYSHLIAAARQANPDLKLVLATPFVGQAGKIGQAPDYARRDSLIAQLSLAVARIATENQAVLLRFDSLFTAQRTLHPTVAVNHWLWDGIHPSPAGHKLMADYWLQACSEAGIISRKK